MDVGKVDTNSIYSDTITALHFRFLIKKIVHEIKQSTDFSITESDKNFLTRIADIGEYSLHWKVSWNMYNITKDNATSVNEQL